MKTNQGTLGASLIAVAALGMATWMGCSSSSPASGSGSSGGGSSGTGSSTGGSGSSGGSTGSGASTGGSGASGSSSGSGSASGSSGATGATGTPDAGGDAPSDAPITDASDAAPGKEVIYSNSGANLNVFDFNASDGTLTLKPSLTVALPQILQFAQFDSLQKYFYVGATTAPANYLYAFSVDPAAGGLTMIGNLIDGGAADGGNTQGILSPNGRVINLTLSRDNSYLLAVHNVTKAYTVFQLNADGTIGNRVLPTVDGGDTNVGAFIHQIRVDPTNKYVTICDRGNDPAVGTNAEGGTVITPEDLGHILTYSYTNGELTPLQNITFPSGIGPRHLDFHPTKPWVYVSAERGNKLMTYSIANGVLTQQFITSSLANAADGTHINATEAVFGQRAGAIMVHPSGQYLYMTNRNYQSVSYTADADAAGGDASDATASTPVNVFVGQGENNVALFSIDQSTGEPKFVSAVDTHGFEPRTFALDPSGRYLLVGNQKNVNVLGDAGVTLVPANIAVFSVGAAGALTFVNKYDQGPGEVWWVGGRAVTGP